MMFSKINVMDIVIDHFGTLRNYRTGQRSRGDMILFFGVPTVVAAAMLYGGLLVSKSAVNVLFTGISIFAGLLFNLLVLVHGIIRTVDAPRYQDELRLMREVYSNVSYAILTSVVMLGVLLVRFVTDQLLVLYLMSALTYFLIGNFLLTLLLVLKRIHVVLGREFESDRTGRSLRPKT